MKNQIVYQVPEMNDVKIRENIIYKAIKKTALYMDACYPPDFKKNKKYPAVILISGGVSDPAKPGSRLRDIYLSWGRLLAANGLAAVYFTWRFKHTDDISDLITYIKDNADALNLDGKRICTFSFSRGVGLSFNEIVNTKNYSIKSMVYYYGKISTGILKSKTFSLPPALIVMAGRDRFFSPDCNDMFIKRARSLNNIVELIVHETGEHAFDIRKQDNRSVEIIKSTIDFILGHLR